MAPKEPTPFQKYGQSHFTIVLFPVLS
jgi:hypothetical protein